MKFDNTATSESQAQQEKPLLRKWKFMTAVMGDPELTADARNVAFVLMDILNNADGYARPGHKHIAKQAGTNVTAVKRGITALQRRGWFCVQPMFSDVGDQDPNRYYPIWKRAGAPAPAGSEKVKKATRVKASAPTADAVDVREVEVDHQKLPWE